MNIFVQLIKSLYSPKDIATYRNQGMWKTIFYILLLGVICLIPPIIITSILVNHISTGVNHVMENLPDFEIKDAQLESSLEEPVYFDEGELTIIFDSTGTITESNIKSKFDSIGFLKNGVVFNFDGNVDTIEYKSIELYELSKSDIESAIHSVQSLVPLFYVGMVIFILAGLFFNVTILAVVGLIIRRALQISISYGQLWKLSAYAITLATVFFTIMSALQISIPFSGIINWAVFVIMLYLTLKEVKKDEPDTFTQIQ